MNERVQALLDEVGTDVSGKWISVDFIKQQVDEDGEPVDYEFHEVDTELMTDAMSQQWEE